MSFRLAPEHPYPAADDDACHALCWIATYAAEIGADPERLAVDGDSAGGLPAAVAAQKASRNGLPCVFKYCFTQI